MLLELKWTQVDFSDKVIRFVRVQNRKSVPVAGRIYGDMEKLVAPGKRSATNTFQTVSSSSFGIRLTAKSPVTKKGHGGRRGTPGTPIKSFYDSWRWAVKAAGYPDLLFHDLRRSAVRNMIEKIRTSEKKAMLISGHKTRSCFERYHIVSLEDIQEIGQKMDQWFKTQRKEEPE